MSWTFGLGAALQISTFVMVSWFALLPEDCNLAQPHTGFRPYSQSGGLTRLLGFYVNGKPYALKAMEGFGG